MSYILDALRKSEQERQKNTGQGISLPHPVTVNHKNDSRTAPVFLAIIGTICVGLVVWWIGFAGKADQPSAPQPAAVLPTAPQPKPVVAETPAESLPKPPKRMEVTPREPVAATPRKQPAPNPVAPAPVVAAPSKPDNDPLKGLPPLNITGFMHNEQGGNMAIINDRILVEGDEVSPGLRVEKIKVDSVIFSYRGYVFSR